MNDSSLAGRLIGEALADFRARLAVLSEQPMLEAALLLAHAAQKSKAWILAHPEAGLTLAQDQAAEALVTRRLRGIPLPYLVGRWEFFGLEFEINPGVLIPRPETELLVETALQWLRLHPGRNRLLEVGCGSGCICVTLAVHAGRVFAAAGDLSPRAALTARANAVRLGVSDRLGLYCGDLAGPLVGQFDLVCANLPYIPTSHLAGLDAARYEPRQALDGGRGGLQVIRRFLVDAPRLLAQAGLLLLEIDSSQGEASLRLARRSFPEAEARVLPDLAGRDRLLEIQLP